MKILYFAHIRMPTDRAHGLQTIQMCQAFAEHGHSVTLVVPNKKNAITESVESYYQMEKKISLVYLPMLNWGTEKKWGFILQHIIFMVLSLFYVLFHSHDVLYVKDEKIPYLVSSLKKNIIWEPHVGKLDMFGKKLARKSAGIIALTEGVKKDLILKGAPKEKIIVAHDAVDLERFSIEIDKRNIRKKLGLPLNKNIVLYTGHLFEWKGVYTLGSAIEYLDDSFHIFFVGGTKKDIPVFREHFASETRVHILGHKKHSEIPFYLKAADVTVLPNSAQFDISRSHTSPLKMFEYMASKTPIVASDLPSLREVLNEKNAFLVEPDNPEKLAQTLQEVICDAKKAERRTQNAYNDVYENTWYNRANYILSFMKERIST